MEAHIHAELGRIFILSLSKDESPPPPNTHPLTPKPQTPETPKPPPPLHPPLQKNPLPLRGRVRVGVNPQVSRRPPRVRGYGVWQSAYPKTKFAANPYRRPSNRNRVAPGSVPTRTQARRPSRSSPGNASPCVS